MCDLRQVSLRKEKCIEIGGAPAAKTPRPRGRGGLAAWELGSLGAWGLAPTTSLNTAVLMVRLCLPRLRVKYLSQMVARFGLAIGAHKSVTQAPERSDPPTRMSARKNVNWHTAAIAMRLAVDLAARLSNLSICQQLPASSLRQRDRGEDDDGIANRSKDADRGAQRNRSRQDAHKCWKERSDASAEIVAKALTRAAQACRKQFSEHWSNAAENSGSEEAKRKSQHEHQPV